MFGATLLHFGVFWVFGATTLHFGVFSVFGATSLHFGVFWVFGARTLHFGVCLGVWGDKGACGAAALVPRSRSSGLSEGPGCEAPRPLHNKTVGVGPRGLPPRSDPEV